MNRLISATVGSVVEAWAELRIHRTRVLLSLIGVAVAIAALTSVVGVGAIAQQSSAEVFERQSGRPANLYVSAFAPDATTNDAQAATSTAFFDVAARYSISWASRNAYTQVRLALPDGVRPIDAMIVDADYGVIHRVDVESGRWFDDSDVDRLAPSTIVNHAMWVELGSPDLRTHPTVQLAGASPRPAVVVGVVADAFPDMAPTLMLLFDAYAQGASAEELAQLYPSYELWVPPELADQLTELVRRDIAGELGEGWQVDVGRQDYLAYQGADPLEPTRLVVIGVAVLILLLGALSLVNISLVTIRQRIREIGIRRSFGATAGRVFFAVMMESVVGTLAAGVVGVFIAVLVVQSEPVQRFIGQGVTDLPPFPVEAALLGIAAATAVGALAGLLPALVAVRVRVIDAIRF